MKNGGTVERRNGGSRLRLPGFAVAATLALEACAGGGRWVELETTSGGGEVLSISGTVRHLDLEGGVFVIRDAGGTQYNPTNLPEAFRVDGMAVEAEARRRDDMASIGMVGPIVELLRIREQPGGAAGPAGDTGATAARPEASDLMGTPWRLEDLAGKGVVDRAVATLEFPGDGFAGGNGSCNQFRGPVAIDGRTIAFGPMVATRMFCGEAVSRQETEYLAALDATERWEIRGSFLYLYATGHPEPLRFVRE